MNNLLLERIPQLSLFKSGRLLLLPTEGILKDVGVVHGSAEQGHENGKYTEQTHIVKNQFFKEWECMEFLSLTSLG